MHLFNELYIYTSYHGIMRTLTERSTPFPISKIRCLKGVILTLCEFSYMLTRRWIVTNVTKREM